MSRPPPSRSSKSDASLWLKTWHEASSPGVVAGFVLSPALQTRVVNAAGPDNTLASSLNISAFNVGIATGSLVGTAVVVRGGLAATPFVAAGLAAFAIIPAVVGSVVLTSARTPEATGIGASAGAASD
jgi:DHA1 family inner membrane transport protein